MIDLTDLRDRLQRLSAAANTAWGTLSSGFAELDAVLPSNGLRRGSLVEWIADREGAGAMCCALRTARSAMSDDRPLVIVDRNDTFHPPGLGDAVSWSQVLLVRTSSDVEADWAVSQSLRTSGVGSVLIRFDRHDDRQLRRWQLAAESSGAVGLIVRNLVRRPEACFSDVRFQVSPLPVAEGRRLQLEILRSRQGGIGAVVQVRLDDDAHPLFTPRTVAVDRRAARA